MDAFNTLKDYQPERIRDGFEIIKAKGLRCAFDYARIEPYTGPNSELQGTENFVYKLTVIEHPEFTGRCFWARFNLSDETKLKKLADQLFTLGITFKSREELENACEEIVQKEVNVRAWGWTPDGNSEAIQQHLIKGEWQEKSTGDKKPAF